MSIIFLLFLVFFNLGSYNGEILVWSLDNTKLLFAIRKKSDLVYKSQDTNCAVDKLLFIKESESQYGGLNSIRLISSEAGRVLFWLMSIQRENRFLGSFYASAFENQAVSALALNHDNTVLITGDTKGFIYLWNIEHVSKAPNKGFVEPTLMNAWRCHDNEMFSCQYIKETDRLVMRTELIVTTSADWTCRVWTLEGGYVGAFGQELKWNLNDADSYESMASLENVHEQIQRLTRPKSYRDVSFELFLSAIIWHTRKKLFEYICIFL